MSKTLARIICIAVAGALFMPISGCNGDIKDYCEVWADCVGANENDQEACIEMLKAEKNVAKEFDCKDEWKAHMECWADQVECNDTVDMVTGIEDCSTEDTKWGECEERGSELR
jgi:hypothetical protein